MRLRRQRPLWISIIYFLAGLSLAYLIGCFRLAQGYLSPERIGSIKPAHAAAVKIPNGKYPAPAYVSNGLAAGQPKSDVIFIFAHGYGGSRASWTAALEDIVAAGYEAIVPSMPGHDDSTDPTSGFGEKEADVLLSCSRWAKSQCKKPPKIVFVGVSLGGSAAWLALGKDPKAADAIFTEDAFPTLLEATDRHLSGSLRGGATILAPVIFFASRMSGVDPSAVNPIEAAAKWKGKPAMIVRCAGDTLFPLEFSERMSKAAGCEMWTVPDAPHANGYWIAKTEYMKRLLAMAKALKPKP